MGKLAGVSQSAVSRTFTDGASASPVTRAKVLEAARQLGYRPNLVARTLRTRRSQTIGVTMAYLENQFYPEVLERLSNRLQREGCHILLFTADPRSDTDPLLHEILRHQVDALVLASTSLSSGLAEECRAVGVPVVLFNRTSDFSTVSSVTGENEEGARKIGAFLAAGGHRRFAYVAGLENSSTNRDREAGFRAYLEENGLPLVARAVGHYSFEGATRAARQVFRTTPQPDAVFCANDHTALAVMEVARSEFGLRVPQDVSIVGFDDVGPARWPSYDLTTYSQPVEPMVNALVAILRKAMQDPNAPPERVIVPGSLILRGSARRPPNGQAV